MISPAALILALCLFLTGCASVPAPSIAEGKGYEELYARFRDRELERDLNRP